MGVDVAAIWRQFPIAETATLLLFTAAYASAFVILAARQLHIRREAQPQPLVFLGGLGFAGIAFFLQFAILAYLDQPPSLLEACLLAIGFFALGLAGSSLSIRSLRRQHQSGTAGGRGSVSAVGFFCLGVVVALALYRLVAGGLLLLFLTQ
jgi:hypothetical protein